MLVEIEKFRGIKRLKQNETDFNGGISTAVEDLSSFDDLDGCHCRHFDLTRFPCLLLFRLFSEKITKGLVYLFEKRSSTTTLIWSRPLVLFKAAPRERLWLISWASREVDEIRCFTDHDHNPKYRLAFNNFPLCLQFWHVAYHNKWVRSWTKHRNISPFNRWKA